MHRDLTYLGEPVPAREEATKFEAYRVMHKVNSTDSDFHNVLHSGRYLPLAVRILDDWESWLAVASGGQIKNLINHPEQHRAILMGTEMTDFKRPIPVGLVIFIELRILKMGQSSLVVRVDYTTQTGDIFGQTEMALVHVNTLTGKGVPFPEAFSDFIHQKWVVPVDALSKILALRKLETTHS